MSGGHLHVQHAPLAQPKPSTSTSTSTAERELEVHIRPLRLNFWEYRGTRAQLQAEGAIPAGLDWPAGKAAREWAAGRFRFTLYRVRPEGSKAPRMAWAQGDWWCLRVYLIDGPGMNELSVQDKRRELAAAIHRQSPAGQAALGALHERLRHAQRDAAFQAFKAVCLPAPRTARRALKAPSSLVDLARPGVGLVRVGGAS